MNKLLDAFRSGTVEQQNRRRNGIIVICVTALLLILSLLIFAVGSIVRAVSEPSDPTPTPNDSELTGSYTTTTLEAAQVKTGNLLLLDDTHAYEGNPEVVLFANHKSRPKNTAGKNIYTIFGTDTLSATEETVLAFHDMIKDFYEQTQDENLILDGAYNVKSGNQADKRYTAGTVVSLSYYTYYTSSADYEMKSIYEVETYEWIYENAAEYGFVQVSEEKGEENMFRYVGQPHATYLAKNNKTVAEYLTLLKEKHTYQSPLKISAPGEDGKNVSYSVYYLSAEEMLYVPKHGQYTVSGDNESGYVITVNNTAAKTK